MQETINSKYKSLRTSVLIDTLCVPMLNVGLYRVGTHKKLKENTEALCRNSFCDLEVKMKNLCLLSIIALAINAILISELVKFKSSQNSFIK